MLKRFLIILSLLFSCALYAATETINWYAEDGTLYDTTTCQTGGDITLPTTPTKYGYTFQGWKGIFYRGEFQSVYAVPQDASLYQTDVYGSSVPQADDYIVIDNAAGFIDLDFFNDIDNVVFQRSGGYMVKIIVGDNSINVNYTAIGDYKTIRELFELKGYEGIGCEWLQIKYNGYWYITSNDVYYVNNQLHSGSYLLMSTETPTTDIFYVSRKTGAAPQVLSGMWRFKYTGDWYTNGKNGWKPQYAINQQ